MAKSSNPGAMLVVGFRPGVVFRTASGAFRNGSKPTDAQLKYLKSQYELTSARPDEVQPEALQSQSTMREAQIVQQNGSRTEADALADEAASKAAATGGRKKETAEDVGGGPSAAGSPPPEE